MTTDTTEKGLEAYISQYLVEENKYLLRENKAYNNVSCIDSELLFQFLEATQPKAVGKLKTFHKDLYALVSTKSH
jgi:type I restriction enzyme R subunit